MSADEDAHYAYGYHTSGGVGWVGVLILYVVLAFAVFA